MYSKKLFMSLAKNEEKKFRRKVVFYYQDNARPDVNLMTGWTLYKVEWELMQYPLYCPDLALSNFYLFLNLQLHRDDEIFK